MRKRLAVEADEHAFLKKMIFTFGTTTIRPPEPTLCPDFRLQERTCHRNERFLHKHRSALSGKDIIALYRKTRLPIPWKHPDVRYDERLALRNPRHLWKRPCGKCGKEMETTYAPERPEIVYCESCYLQEVY